MSVLYLDSCGDHYNTTQLSRKWENSSGTAAFIDTDGRTGNCIHIPPSHFIGKRVEIMGDLFVSNIDPTTIGAYFMWPGVFAPGRMLVYASPEHGLLGTLEFRDGLLQVFGSGIDINSLLHGPHVLLAETAFSGEPDRWYAIEYKHHLEFNSRYQVRIDNVDYLNNLIDPVSSVTRQQLIQLRGGASGMKVDDLYVLQSEDPDSLGHNKPLSETYGLGWSVGIVRPNGAGFYTDYTPVPDLGIPHWQMLTQLSTPDDDATRLEDSTLNNKETWGIENLPADPLLETVIAVQSVYCLKPIDEGSQFTHLIRDAASSDTSSPIFDPNPSLEENGDGSVLGYRYWSFCWEAGWETESPPGTVAIRVSEFNATQFGIKTNDTSPDINRITQHVVEVLFPFQIVPPDPPELPTVELTTVQSHKFTKLWKIVRPDGTQFRFTDHNQTLVNPQDGLVYTPVASWKTSAHLSESGLMPSTNEFQGLLGAILNADIFAGLFRGSTVTEYILDFVYPWAGVLLVTERILDIQTNDQEQWSGTLFGRRILLQRPVGDIYSRTCRHILGDTKCQFPISTLKESGQTVTSVARVNSTFSISGIPTSADAQGNDRNVDSYWDFGKVTWLTGSNTGLVQEIRAFTIATKDFILSIPTPFTIVSGDTCDVEPGCNKLLGTCNIKFDNLPNFGGFPTIPGYDRAHQPLSSSTRVFGIGDLIDFIGGIL